MFKFPKKASESLLHGVFRYNKQLNFFVAWSFEFQLKTEAYMCMYVVCTKQFLYCIYNLATFLLQIRNQILS